MGGGPVVEAGFGGEDVGTGGRGAGSEDVVRGEVDVDDLEGVDVDKGTGDGGGGVEVEIGADGVDELIPDGR